MTLLATVTGWLAGLSFHRPWCLVFLPLPWLVYRFMPGSRRTEPALFMPFYSQLPLDKITPGISAMSSWRVWLSALIWLLLVTAATTPRYLGPPIQLAVTGRDTLLAVDLSDSMATEDMLLQGRPINRLDSIKRILSSFISNRKGDRVGLILFGTNAYLQTPLTLDTQTVHTLLNEASVGIAGPKTAIGDAIGLAVRQLRKGPTTNRVLILLTDGANTAGHLTPLQAAELAARARITIYTLGVGNDTAPFHARPDHQGRTSSDLDEDTLGRIAELTGGRYFRARSSRDLKAIYQTLDKLEPVELGQAVFRPPQDLFYWPLALAFILSGWLALDCLGTRKAGE